MLFWMWVSLVLSLLGVIIVWVSRDVGLGLTTVLWILIRQLVLTLILLSICRVFSQIMLLFFVLWFLVIFIKIKFFNLKISSLIILNVFLQVKEASNFNPHSNPMHAFTLLVAQTRSHLLNWRLNGMNSIETNLINTELEIHALETNNALYAPNDALHANLKSLYNKFFAH